MPRDAARENTRKLTEARQQLLEALQQARTDADRAIIMAAMEEVDRALAESRKTLASVWKASTT